MRKAKRKRQQLLKETIQQTPFITDEELAKKFSVSVQTIRLDRVELNIPELRKRIKSVSTSQWNETVKSLTLEDIIGEVIDLDLDRRAISILDIGKEHVFSKKNIARGHHLFAQANSLAVAVIDDELALTVQATIEFSRQVKEGERVVAKAVVEEINDDGLTIVHVNSYVDQVHVFKGTFHMYRSTE